MSYLVKGEGRFSFEKMYMELNRRNLFKSFVFDKYGYWCFSLDDDVKPHDIICKECVEFEQGELTFVTEKIVQENLKI